VYLATGAAVYVYDTPRTATSTPSEHRFIANLPFSRRRLSSSGSRAVPFCFWDSFNQPESLADSGASTYLGMNSKRFTSHSTDRAEFFDIPTMPHRKYHMLSYDLSNHDLLEREVKRLPLHR
jgi:hypothetical protein